MRVNKIKFVIGLALFWSVTTMLVFADIAPAATTHHVGDGYFFDKIQDAINTAEDGDTVLVHDGTYVENINFNGLAITVKSENGATSTTIDGNQNSSVVTFDSGEESGSVLDGFKLINGSGTLTEVSPRYFVMSGGGILCNNSSSPSIINCTISGNSASKGRGGGVCSIFASSPSITDCTISSNSSSPDYS